MRDLRETALAVKAASAELGLLGTEKRNEALAAIADALLAVSYTHLTLPTT